MTTIVFKDGILAADTRAYAGDKTPLGQKVKIFRLEDGSLVGASTVTPGGGEQLVQWARDGYDQSVENLPEFFTFIAILPDGTAMYASNSPRLSGPITAPYFAIGSGEHFAQGALEMGASAVEAVLVACKLDLCTSEPIMTITH